MGLFLSLLLLLAVQYGGFFLLSLFIDNPFLIYLILDLVIAFGFPIITIPKGRRSGFYKNPFYHVSACIMAIFLLGVNMLMWWVQGL